MIIKGCRQTLQISLLLLMTLQGCSKTPSSVDSQETPPVGEELTNLLKWDAEAAEADALDALAIPFIKDPKIRERLGQMHWCGTPEMKYLANNPRPSEDVLIARAAEMEIAWQEPGFE